MRSTFLRSLITTSLFATVSLMTDTPRVFPGSSPPPEAGQQDPLQFPNLPFGLTKSDWKAMMDAHESWQLTIRPTKMGWRARNAPTGLTATFDLRGAEIQSDQADWRWGLELLSYGVGSAQTSVHHALPPSATKAVESSTTVATTSRNGIGTIQLGLSTATRFGNAHPMRMAPSHSCCAWACVARSSSLDVCPDVISLSATQTVRHSSITRA